MKLIKNANLILADKEGLQDVLISGESIIHIDHNIEISGIEVEKIDAQGKFVTPGLIDQHIHTLGAGGKHGFHSMSPELTLSDLISCGTTTVMGLLGTDGMARSINTLYAKTKALEIEGVSAYMLTSYFGLPPITITGNVQLDVSFIDKVLGCKIAISDPRSSFPTTKELLNLLRQVKVGGMLAGKKGILHLHLGALPSKLDPVMEIVDNGLFPIQHISPTHCGRTKDLLEQSMLFANQGGMIDISTGGTNFTECYKMIEYCVEHQTSIDNITFSSDGNAGLDVFDDDGNLIGFRKAPIDTNLLQVQELLKAGNVSARDAFKLITINPAKNLGLKKKGLIQVGMDADFCFFDEKFNLTDVMARGTMMMEEQKLIKKGSFELG